MRGKSTRVATALAALLVIVAPAPAQSFDLPAPVTAPTLTSPTYVDHLLTTLDMEVRRLGQSETGLKDAPRTVTRALINVRIAAIELLFTGATDPEGHFAVHAGMRLAHLRHDLDDVLPPLAGDPDAADIIDELQSFNESLLDRATGLRETNIEVLDAELAALFMPLRQAVRYARERAPEPDGAVLAPPPPPWPTIDDVAAAHPPDGSTSNVRGPHVDGDRVRAVFGTGASADVAQRVLDYLERGAAFPEFQRQVARGRRDLDRALTIAESIAATGDWLPDDDRAALQHRVHAVLASYLDPERRTDALAWLADLDAMCTVLQRLDAIDVPRKDREILLDAWRRAETIERRPALDLPLGAAPDDAARVRFDVVLRRMAGYRDRPATDLPRDFMRVRARLDEGYRNAERALLERLTAIVDGSASVTDPAVQSLLTDQRQYLADLQRIDRVPAWLELVSDLDEVAGRTLARTLRDWTRQLDDAGRRPRAIRQFETFDDQFMRYHRLPFESELEAGGDDVLEFTGGVRDELLEVIRSERRRWAEAWGRGEDAADAPGALPALAELGERLADVAALGDLSRVESTLRHWGAWEAPWIVASRSVADLPVRVKLTCADAANRRWLPMRDQLARIERELPHVRFLMQIARQLEPILDVECDRLRSALDKVTTPPGPRAWRVEDRAAIALYSRYIIEADFARTQKRTDQLAAITAFVDQLARDLTSE